MEAARTSETSVDNYFTRQCIPEDNSELHTPRRENLKSHISVAVLRVNVFAHGVNIILWSVLFPTNNLLLVFGFSRLYFDVQIRLSVNIKLH
jgi:hypothetical protein